MSRWGIPTAAVVTGVVGMTVKIGLSAPALWDSAPMVTITWLVSASFILVGWTLFRSGVPPANGWACLLVALATLPGDFNAPEFRGTGLVYLGWLFEYVYLAAGTALVLRYPRARLQSYEAAIVVALLVTGVVPRVGQLVVSGRLPDGLYAPFPFERTRAPLLHDWLLVGTQRVGTALLLIVSAVILTTRVRTGARARREAPLPMTLAAVMVSLFAAADLLTWVVGASGESWIPALGRNLFSAILPVTIVVDLLRRRSAAALIGDRVVNRAAAGDLPGLQAALRESLADPELLVAVTRDGSEMVGSDGRPLPDHAHLRAADVMGASGRLLCTVAYDPSAIEDQHLLDAALEAARLGLENARLSADAIAYVAELEDSRMRIISAGVEERRRLERDLHDGAQQHFLAVAARLAAARLLEDPQAMRAAVSEASAQLSEALSDLRRLARGIHPATLTQGGLGPSLASVADLCPVAVALDLDESIHQRFDPTIESTAHFFATEVVANAVKHSQAQGITITGSASATTLRLSITDAGVGGARVEPGGGLEGLRDRVTALGGTFVLQDLDGLGTRVCATLPL